MDTIKIVIDPRFDLAQAGHDTSEAKSFRAAWGSALDAIATRIGADVSHTWSTYDSAEALDYETETDGEGPDSIEHDLWQLAHDLVTRRDDGTWRADTDAAASAVRDDDGVIDEGTMWSRLGSHALGKVRALTDRIDRLCHDEDLASGIDALDAGENTDGSYVYHADETGKDYRVSGDSLAQYGAMLRRNVTDAYSHWAGGSDAEEIEAA